MRRTQQQQAFDINTITVPSSDPNRASKIVDSLRENGVVVIQGVFTNQECDQFIESTLDKMKLINPDIDYNRIESTWRPENFFPQTRPGMFKQGYSFLSWEVRQSPILVEIFKETYSGLRGYPITKLVTSIDGINVRPPIEPFYDPSSSDWPHLDQTSTDDPFLCVQGQVVFTNTTAGFRCSPKSHKVFGDILRRYNKLGKEGDWFLFNNSQKVEVKRIVENVGGHWQVPILAPKGSVILWTSSLVHSGKLCDPGFEIDPLDRWKHWRVVFYISLRPREDVDESHVQRLQHVFRKNQSTNHWGNKIVTLSKSDNRKSAFSPNIVRFLENPELVYHLPGMSLPELSPLGEELLGM